VDDHQTVHIAGIFQFNGQVFRMNDFYTPFQKRDVLWERPWWAGVWAGGVQFCPEHISYTHGGILTKLHRNVNHYEKLCRAHEPGL
jgi:hypothetical protein